MKKLLEKLSNASGVSGFEDEVRNIMMDELKEHVDDLEIDEMGERGLLSLIYNHFDQVLTEIILACKQDESV